MSKFAVAIVLSTLVAGSLFADGFSATDPASYDVVRTGSPPTIDGIISPGEWSSAAAAAAGARSEGGAKQLTTARGVATESLSRAAVAAAGRGIEFD